MEQVINGLGMERTHCYYTGQQVAVVVWEFCITLFPLEVQSGGGGVKRAMSVFRTSYLWSYPISFD